MTRSELQALLKIARSKGLTTIKLNGTKASLQAEYDRIEAEARATREALEAAAQPFQGMSDDEKDAHESARLERMEEIFSKTRFISKQIRDQKKAFSDADVSELEAARNELNRQYAALELEVMAINA